MNTYLSLLLNKCDDMHIENLAYSSSDWRSISPKEPLCKLTLNRDQSYWPKSFASSVHLWFSPACPGFFFLFFFRPTDSVLREATPAREQVFISAVPKAARPARFESVIELREVCGGFVRVSSTGKNFAESDKVAL